MSSAELAQFLSKLTRAIYISPKLFTVSQRPTTLSFIDRLTELLATKKAIDLPMANLADFTVICDRFNFNNKKQIATIFTEKVKE